MANHVKVAKGLLKKGYPVLPVSNTKIPTIPNWRKYQKELMPLEVAEKEFENVESIAIFCGGPWRIFCLDIDTKYDLSGTLFEDLKKAVPNSILRKGMCQRTQSGGYHLVFKVPASRLLKNEKFASRHTTADEKHETYLKAYRKQETKDIALKIAMHDKSRVLLESRSGTEECAGGYFLIAPSPNYEILGGKIGELTEGEYDILVETARSFNQFVTEERIIKESEYKTQWTKTPFEHYNEEGDALQVLYNNGWSKVYSKGKDVKLKRPGSTHTKDSAYFDTERNMFFCYSTSTVFEANKGYNAASLYILVEHEGNAVEAYKSLIAKGWGVK